MKASRMDLIEKKVFRGLGEAEVLKFDQLLASDPDFAKEYFLFKNVMNYIAKKDLMDFRDKLNSVHQDFISSSPTKSKIVSFSQIKYYAASVAAVALIFIGSYFYLNQQKTADQLFQQYYHVDDVYLNTRSGNANATGLLEQGLLLFEKDQYKESINYFEQLPTSITAVYYSGVAHMELNEYEVAIYKFDQVISDYLNVFYDQANWYKGLCLLKQNKTAEAKNIFQSISKTDSYYSIQAKELLNKLK